MKTKHDIIPSTPIYDPVGFKSRLGLAFLGTTRLRQQIASLQKWVEYLETDLSLLATHVEHLEQQDTDNDKQTTDAISEVHTPKQV